MYRTTSHRRKSPGLETRLHLISGPRPSGKRRKFRDLICLGRKMPLLAFAGTSGHGQVFAQSRPGKIHHARKISEVMHDGKPFSPISETFKAVLFIRWPSTGLAASVLKSPRPDGEIMGSPPRISHRRNPVSSGINHDFDRSPTARNLLNGGTHVIQCLENPGETAPEPRVEESWIADGGTTPSSAALLSHWMNGRRPEMSARALDAPPCAVYRRRSGTVLTSSHRGDCAGLSTYRPPRHSSSRGRIKVAKHGNRSRQANAFRRRTGALGFELQCPFAMECCIGSRHRFSFRSDHAPAMKAVAPVRRELKVRTIFKILDP